MEYSGKKIKGYIFLFLYNCIRHASSEPFLSCLFILKRLNGVWFSEGIHPSAKNLKVFRLLWRKVQWMSISISITLWSYSNLRYIYDPWRALFSLPSPQQDFWEVTRCYASTRGDIFSPNKVTLCLKSPKDHSCWVSKAKEIICQRKVISKPRFKQLIICCYVSPCLAQASLLP